MSTASQVIKTSQSFQRRRIAMVMLVGMLLAFWLFSRYPDLFGEYMKASNGVLIDREAGVLSKDAMLATHNVTGPFERLLNATVDWLDTNKIGMSFGFLFSAAILVFLEQSMALRKRASRNGIRGVFSGLLLGMPLGVCTNCATPVALGLKKSGISDDASFTTLIASPSLNPIGLFILTLIFPWQAGLWRVGVIVAFLFLLLPLITKQFRTTEPPLFEVDPPNDNAEPTESWQQSLQYCLQRYGHYLVYMVKKVLPLMLVMGFLGVMILVLFPLEHFLIGHSTTAWDIVLSGVIGAVLPVPMFVDIILVYILYSMGLPFSIAVTLLITMAPVSAFALFVMAKNTHNWRLSLAIGCTVCLLGIASGLVVHYQQLHSGEANSQTAQFKPFEVAKTIKPTAAFDFATFDSFFGAGVSIIDYNNDGLNDIFLAGNAGARLFKNTGNMKFIDVTKQSKIFNTHESMAGIWGDFNNDGLLDLYVVNYRNKAGKGQRNRLFQNKGDGTFFDVTKKMGLLDKDLSSSAAWADYDNDGDLDLFVSNYGKIWMKPDRDIGGLSANDRLYRNDGDRFVDVTKEAGVGGKIYSTEQLMDVDNNKIAGNRGFSFQPVWLDYNNDNLSDLFVTQDFGTNQLYKNLGNGKFKNVTKESGLRVYGTNMGVTVVDINQDGFWDLFVTTGKANQVWINQGGSKFIDQSLLLGMGDEQRFGWGVTSIDQANTGQQDYFVINGPTAKGSALNRFQALMAKVGGENQFYVKSGVSKFRNLDKKYWLYNDMLGRGVATGDLDNDGFTDMVISNRDDKEQMIIYQNKHQKGNRLDILLIGQGPVNRMAVGSKVSVYSNGQVQHQLLSAGTSFLSQHSAVLHFGLGKAKKAEKVVITWPNGKQTHLKQVSVNKKLTILYPAKETPNAKNDLK